MRIFFHHPKSSVLYLTAVLLSVVFAPIPATSTEQLGFEDFSITLPVGWVEIPRPVIEEQLKRLVSATNNSDVPQFAAGIQPVEEELWFGGQYILIQLDRGGRISEREFERMSEISLNTFKEDANEKLSPVVRIQRYGATIFDRQNNIIWQRAKVDGPAGPTEAASAWIPTEFGMILVHGYSRSDQFSQFSDLFSEFVLSVAPTEEAKYKPRSRNSFLVFVSDLRLGQRLQNAGKYALYGVVFAVATTIFRRKKKNKDVP